MYTGRGDDTVGPALYNPNPELSKKRAPIGDFQTSKETRKVFEPTIHIENKSCPPRDNPGPGAYDSKSTVANKKTFNHQEKQSIFMSSVPNCKD